MKFAFIGVQLSGQQAQLERWSASALCRTVGVARSGYAAWCRRQSQAPTPHQQEKQQAEAWLRLTIRQRIAPGAVTTAARVSTMSCASKAFG